MKTNSILAATLLCGLILTQPAFAQQNSEIKLDAAIPVGVRIAGAQWHPNGQTIMYTRNEETSVGLGIYSLGQYEGKIVLNVPKTETYRWHWLEGSKSALVVVTKDIKDGKAPTKHVKIFLVEGEAQTARQIYNEVMDSKLVSYVGVNASPLLKHAIVSFNGEKGVKNYVLCTGRGDLISSVDLDNATSKGLYPSWSLDGTAVFYYHQRYRRWWAGCGGDRSQYRIYCRRCERSQIGQNHYCSSSPSFSSNR
jgi:Tol biopolymer transport system component